MNWAPFPTQQKTSRDLEPRIEVEVSGWKKSLEETSGLSAILAKLTQQDSCWRQSGVVRCPGDIQSDIKGGRFLPNFFCSILAKTGAKEPRIEPKVRSYQHGTVHNLTQVWSRSKSCTWGWSSESPWVTPKKPIPSSAYPFGGQF